MHPSTPSVPLLHVRPVRGWLNDPNGITRHGGRWHVFYQHDPLWAQHGDIAGAHVSRAGTGGPRASGRPGRPRLPERARVEVGSPRGLALVAGDARVKLGPGTSDVWVGGPVAEVFRPERSPARSAVRRRPVVSGGELSAGVTVRELVPPG